MKFSLWRLSHWRVRFSLWRGQRIRRRIYSDDELKSSLDMVTRICGQQIAWEYVEGFTFAFFGKYESDPDQFKRAARAAGMTTAQFFAKTLVKGCREHFEEKNDG